ncbi:uncharacterized protein isoform X2 [Bombus fervidus]|uniref:uncharacterized protein isoform X2 n=1 Tax=Bombus fervidus TaxID=203811 RepID=UPI003D187A71
MRIIVEDVLQAESIILWEETKDEPIAEESREECSFSCSVHNSRSTTPASRSFAVFQTLRSVHNEQSQLPCVSFPQGNLELRDLQFKSMVNLSLNEIQGPGCKT